MRFNYDILDFMKGNESGAIAAMNAIACSERVSAMNGIANETNIGRFQYTGQITIPELGLRVLIHAPSMKACSLPLKARVYSPTLGRFLQTDPIGYEDQINLYAYVGNDPVNLVDPTGLSCEDTGGEASGGTPNGEGGIIPSTYCDPENPDDDGPGIDVNGPDDDADPNNPESVVQESKVCAAARAAHNNAAQNLSGGSAFVRAWEAADAESLSGYKRNAQENADLSRKFNTVVSNGSLLIGGFGLGLRAVGKGLPLAAEAAGLGGGATSTFGYGRLAEDYQERADNIQAAINYFQLVNEGCCVID